MLHESEVVLIFEWSPCPFLQKFLREVGCRWRNSYARDSGLFFAPFSYVLFGDRAKFLGIFFVYFRPCLSLAGSEPLISTKTQTSDSVRCHLSILNCLLNFVFNGMRSH